MKNIAKPGDYKPAKPSSNDHVKATKQDDVKKAGSPLMPMPREPVNLGQSLEHLKELYKNTKPLNTSATFPIG